MSYISVLFILFMLPFICSFNKISTFKGMDNIQFKKFPIILTALTSFAVGFINPYGYKSVFYLLLSGGAKNKTRISELQPMVFTDSYGIICFITVFIVALFASYRFTNFTTPWTIIQKSSVPLAVFVINHVLKYLFLIN